jgi:type IV secretory pathway TrbD component
MVSRDTPATAPVDDNGYRTKLHQAPTLPVMLGGVPRDLCIMWWSMIIAALLAGHMWQALPLGFAVHYLLKRLTKHDPYWFHVLRKHLKYGAYYHG